MCLPLGGMARRVSFASPGRAYLAEDPQDPSMIRNAFMPLRAIYRRAVARGESVSPRFRTPTGRCGRQRCTEVSAAASMVRASCAPVASVADGF